MWLNNTKKSATAKCLQVAVLILLICHLAKQLPLAAAAAAAAQQQQQQLDSDVLARFGPSLRVTQAMSATHVNQLKLFLACASDAVCASNFYISQTTLQLGQITVDDITLAERNQMQDDFTQFSLLLNLWMVRDQGPFTAIADGEAMTVADYLDEDKATWLRVMRVLRMCSENQVWRPNLGCTYQHGKTFVSEVTQQSATAKSKMVLLGLCIVLFIHLMFALRFIHYTKEIVLELRGLK
jgi:hypothetical protein